jgi:hypothetical protein
MKFTFVIMASIVALAALPSMALNVRVKDTPGGPQIHLNGTPIAPRFFWGTPRGETFDVTTEWKEFSFEINPKAAVNGTGILHFRFKEVPCQIWLSDLSITSTVSGRECLPLGSFATSEAFAKNWNVWPVGAENTVGKVNVADGSLVVTLTAPKGAWPDFHLNNKNGMTFNTTSVYRCKFRAKASVSTTVTPDIYRVENGYWNCIGGLHGAFLKQVALARDAGVNLISFTAPNCWSAPEKKIDWAPLDELCRQIIDVNPKALLVPRVSADAPSWWLKLNPDACMVYDDQHKDRDTASPSHRGYRAAAAAQLELIGRHMNEAFPNHFAGLHPIGQQTGEWFYKASFEKPLSGYDSATRDAWRAWLKAKGFPNADSAEPPAGTERRTHPYGLLRDPGKERLLIEFAKFQQEEMADTVLAIAAGTRKGVGANKLVLFFYGYLFEFGLLENGAPISGHYALNKILRGKDIDILCSPVSYHDRDWIGTAPSMTAAESVRRAGILWLNEDDTRTHLDTRAGERPQEGGKVNLSQARQVMLRNTAQASIRNFGTWWMDLLGTGWFNDAALWQEMSRLALVDKAMLGRKKTFTPDIAAIIGEDSMCHLTGDSAKLAVPMTYEARAALGRCGAPYGQYTVEDAVAGYVPSKLQFFLAAWALTPAQRQSLSAKRTPGTTRVWCYAPGYLLPDRADVAAMTDVTGFKHRLIDLNSTEATPTEAGRAFGITKAWGVKKRITPLFTVDDASPESVLATYKDGSPAMVLRKSEHGADIFIGTPQLTPELIRACSRFAGVHLFTQADASVWEAEGYLSIQALKDGDIAIDTGNDRPVTDVLDAKNLGKGPSLVLPMKAGDVRILKWSVSPGANATGIPSATDSSEKDRYLKSNAQTAETQQRISADDPRFLYEGRFNFTDTNAPVVIWEASRISLDFEGETLGLIFDNIKGQNFFNVEVDGSNTIVEASEGKPVDPERLSGFGPGRHHLVLFKRSEATAGTLRFRGVDLAAGAKAWAPKLPAYKLRMEFFGDSCSVGACNEDGPVEQWTNRRTHNSALSYTTLLASAFSGDHRNISVSGMGVVTGYTKMKTEEILDRLYPTTDLPRADLTKWIPDVVLVEVGGNDFTFTEQNKQPFPEGFTDGYVRLVHSVRKIYPTAHIVLLGGSLISELPRSVKLDKAWELAVLRIEAEDKAVSHYVCKHPVKGHPRVADHLALSKEIITWMKQQKFMQPYL